LRNILDRGRDSSDSSLRHRYNILNYATAATATHQSTFIKNPILSSFISTISKPNFNRCKTASEKFLVVRGTWQPIV
jgi:hypothetical protein